MTLAGIVGKVHGSLHLRLGGQLVIGTKPGATGRLIPSFLAGTSLEKGHSGPSWQKDCAHGGGCGRPLRRFVRDHPRIGPLTPQMLGTDDALSPSTRTCPFWICLAVAIRAGWEENAVLVGGGR